MTPPAAPTIGDRLRRLADEPRFRAVVVAMLLAYFVVNGAVAARTHTPTVDEFAYVPAGYYHLRTGDLGYDPSNPPLLKMLMAAPLLAMPLALDGDPVWREDHGGWGKWMFGTRFMDMNRRRYLDAFFAARLVVLAIGAATAVLVWTRARALLSPAAALAVLALSCTMPPLIAHSAVATLDVGVTAFVFAAFVALARLVERGAWPWAIATGALLGCALATKGVAALFIPVIALLLAVRWLPSRGAAPVARALALIAGAAWLTLLAVYGFRGFPLPAPFVEGIRFQAEASGAGEMPAFLNGAWSSRGWWYYYLFALLVKTPLPTLVLAAVGFYCVVRRRLRGAHDLWLVLPPLVLLYVLSFHYGKFYGVRYLLPAFPFLLLLAGHGVDRVLAGRAAAAVPLLLLWQLAATTLAAPHHLAYFNELVWPPDRARRTLLDSNLDWGQDLGRLAAWLDARRIDRVCLGYFGHVDPRAYGIGFTLPPVAPAPGLCAVSANFLAGYGYVITYDETGLRDVPAGAWTWLDRLTPVARIGRSIYVFDVSEDDVRRLSESGARP